MSGGKVARDDARVRTLRRLLSTALAIVAVVGFVAVRSDSATSPDPVGGANGSPAEAGAPVPGTGSAPTATMTTEAVIPLGRRDVTVPILEYHYIRVNPVVRDRLGYNLSVTPADFATQMDWLSANGYHPITFSDLRAYFANQTPLPARPVVLTFDDGYLDFLTTAEPILRAHQFKAVAYIVPGFWGRPGYMTPQELDALSKTGLVEIGSHTVDHANLARSGPAETDYQLTDSRAMLQRTLGVQVLDFCYPSGRFNAGVVAAVARAGYVTATTELPGRVLSWAGRFVWPRVRVSGGEKIGTFVLSLGAPDANVTIRFEVKAPLGRPGYF